MTSIRNFTALGFLVNALASAHKSPPSVDDVIKMAENGELAPAIEAAARISELAPLGLEVQGVVLNSDMEQAIGSQANTWDRAKFFLPADEPNGWHVVVDWIFNYIQGVASDVDATWGN